MNHMRITWLCFPCTLALTVFIACSDDGPAQIEEPVGDSIATFEVTFEGTWSATTHPVSFPPGPHFSGLIGATHAGGFVVWEVGQPASTGIKDVAELGAKGALTAEVEAAIQAGTAGSVVSGGGIAQAPGSVSVTFDVDAEFPLLSLVSMIAPSPDWFVGVRELNLRPNGEWVDSVATSLLPYDAGTDSGASYTSANEVTTPPEPVTALTESPFDAGVPLGRFLVVRR